MIYKKETLLIFLFIVLGGVLLVFGFKYLPKEESGPPLENQGVLENSQEVVYIINKGEENISQYQISSKENQLFFLY